MASRTLGDLLKLPPSERADLALALWESLSDADRAAEVALSPEQESDLFVNLDSPAACRAPTNRSITF